jgi:hypothetical protein
MQFGLQHPSFSFDYKNQDASQIADTLNNIVTKAENAAKLLYTWKMKQY